MISIGELRGLLTLEDRFTPTLQLGLSKLGGIADQMDRVGSRMQQAGSVMTAAITVPLLGIGAAAIKVGMDFEKSLNAIQGVLQTTDGEMAQVRETAIRLGADTAFSAKDAADAILELGKAGFEVSEALEATDEVLQLAAASGLSMAESSELAARTMNGFGLEVEDLAHINDVLAQSVNASTLEIHDLQIALPYVSAIATGFGRSLEEVSAALAIMRDNGIAAETTGRALREMFAKLSNPVKGTLEVFDKLGISLEEVDPTLHSIADIIGVLEAKGLTAADALKAFGDAAGPGIYTMVSEGSDALRQMQSELENSEGAAKKMADAMMEGLPGAFERMKGSVETAMIAIKDAIEPVVIRGMDLISSLADVITNYIVPAFKALPEPVQFTAFAFLGLMAAIGPIIYIAGTLISSMASIGAAYTAVTGVTGGLSVATGILGTALKFIPVIGTVIAGLSLGVTIGGWIDEFTNLSGAVSRVVAYLGEMLYLLPEGTSKMAALNEQIEGQLPMVQGLDKAKSAWIPKLEFAARAQAGLALAFEKTTDKAGDYLAKLREEASAFKNLDAATKANIRTALELDGTVSEIAEAFGVAESAVSRYKEQLDKATKAQEDADKRMSERLDALEDQRNRQNAAIGRQTTAFAQLGVGTNNLAEWFAKLNLVQSQTLQQTAKAEAEALKWAQTNGAVLAPSLKGIGEELKQMDLEREASKWSRMAGIAKNFGESIVRALQGGGNVGKAAGSQLGLDLGNWAGESLTKALSSKIGAGLAGFAGSLLGPLGSMAGGWLGGKIGGFFGKLFGGDKEKKQVEQMRNEVIRAAGGIDAFKAKAEKAGVSLMELFSAKKVEDFQRALQNVDAGISNHAERMNLAKQAAEEFGIPMEKMADSFKQAETDQAGFDLLDKITALMESGLDMGTLIEYAGDDVAAFIKRAMEMGTTVPLEFRKIAEQMIANGTLQVTNTEEFERLTQRKIDLEEQLAEAMKDTSAEGIKKQEELKQQITETNSDLEKTKTQFGSIDDIPWAENLNSMFADLMEKLDQFITKISDGLGGALDGLPDNIDINFNGRWHGDGMPDFDMDGSKRMATGGIVTRATSIIAGEAGPEAIVPMNKVDNMFGEGTEMDPRLLEELQSMNKNIRGLVTQMPAIAAKTMRDALRGAAVATR